MSLFTQTFSSLVTRLLGLLCLVPFLLLMRVYGLGIGLEHIGEGQTLRFVVNSLVPAVTGTVLLLPSLANPLLGRWRHGGTARVVAIVVLLPIVFSALAGFGTLSGMGLQALARAYAIAMPLLILCFVALYIVPGGYGRHLRRRSAMRRGEIDATGRPPPRTEAEAFAREMEDQRRIRAAAFGGNSPSGSHGGRVARAPSGVAAAAPAPQTLRPRPPRRALSAARLIHHLLILPTGAIFLGAIFGSLYANSHAMFIPKSAHYDTAALLGPPVAIVLTYVLTLMMITNHRKEEEEGRPRMPMGRRLLALPLVAGALYLVSPYLLSHVGPALHAWVHQGPRTEIRVQVLQKERFDARRRCDGAVIARSETYGGPHGRRICGLDEELHRRLVVGDTITLSGTETPYGLSYDSVRR